MRSLVIPVALLAGIVAFSLWCGSYVEDRTAEWSEMLEQSDGAAWREDWQTADAHLRQAYKSWQASQTLLHSLLPHEDLEQAEGLFAGAFAACREVDGPDFHTLLAQLEAVMEHLRDAQAVSIRNVL